MWDEQQKVLRMQTKRQETAEMYNIHLSLYFDIVLSLVSGNLI